MSRNIVFKAGYSSIYKAFMIALCILIIMTLIKGQSWVACILFVAIIKLADRMYFTRYTITHTPQGDLLRISKGKLSHDKTIRINDITRIREIKTALALSTYLLLEYGNQHVETVEPKGKKEFINAITKCQSH